MISKRVSWERITQAFSKFFKAQATGGIVLFLFALVALFLANGRYGHQIHSFWHQKHTFFQGKGMLSFSFEFLVNEGGMTLFFLLVGLEIKRELAHGELASFRKAALPIVGATGGMVVPALLFLLLCHGTPLARGWGITIATDIAFAIGVLSVLGRRIPSWIKVFLTSLAIIDDIGSILVIAIFYTNQLSWIALVLAVVVILLMLVLRFLQCKYLILYLILGCMMWVCFLYSGIHATLAGVLTAVLIPQAPASNSPLQTLESADSEKFQGNHSYARFEQGLHIVVTYLVLPLFALCNAAIALPLDHMGLSLQQRLPLAIMVGLCLGKPVGIFGFVWLAVKTRRLSLPERATWLQLFGCVLLAGVGFTISLFIAQLSFRETWLQEQAKIGVLFASTISLFFGVLVLLQVKRKE